MNIEQRRALAGTIPTTNAAHPVGTPVLAFPGAREGRAMLTRTRTPAWSIGKHAVVSVEGYAGGIALTHIEIAEETP